MNIGIDARELLGQRTGVGRYLANLCAEWKKLPRDTSYRFTLYAPADGSDPSVLGPPFDTGPIGPFGYKAVPGKGGSFWEQFQLAEAINYCPPDVLFAPAYSMPLRVTVPVVLTIHDISFTTHPEWFPWREGARRRWLTLQSARRATKVIVVSEFTRRELIIEFGLPSDRVSVVWSGVHRPTQPLALAREPLVLYVGSIFNRRHIPELVRAFAQVSRQITNAHLVLVGDNRSSPRQDPVQLAIKAGIGDRISVKSYVSESELTELYAKATVFVFLSEYEGFGFPPLEAMAAGIPTIVGDTEVARELYMSASIRVPVDDVATIAACIKQLLQNSDKRATLLAAAAARLPHFTWTRAAADTLNLLERAGNR